MATIKINGVRYVLADGPDGSLHGTQIQQDDVPTYVMATEGTPGSTDTQPTKAIAYQDNTGTLGLYKRSQAPGDLTRPYVSDCDNTRPNQLTAWQRYSSTSDTAAIDTDPATGLYPSYIQAIVNDPNGVGFTGVTNSGGGLNFQVGYWQWNGTKFAYIRRAATLSSSGPTGGPNSARINPNGQTYLFPMQIVSPTFTNLWSGLNDSLGFRVYDIAGVSANTANPTTSYNPSGQFFVYFDILFMAYVNAGAIVIKPFRNAGAAIDPTLSAQQVQSVTYQGNSPAQLTIPGERCIMGIAPCEGAVYLATDRCVYAIQWNDHNNTFLSTKLFELPRITGAPVAWNGEVYIPAENRLAHITPGQRGYDWRVVDQLGVLVTPYNAEIRHLAATPDALFAQVIDPTVPSWCILRLDANGAWTCLAINRSSSYGATSPLIVIADGTHPLSIVCDLGAQGTSGGTGIATLLPVPASGRNIRFATNRAQRKTIEGDNVRHVWPWEEGASESAQKQHQRIRVSVLGCKTGFPVKIYYQLNYTDEIGADTFTTGAAKGTGTWHLCAVAVQGTTGSYGSSIDANGNGALWIEFDGVTTFGGGVGVLPLYPSNRQIRFCAEITPDTAGNTVPTLVSFESELIEYITKSFQTQVVIRLQVGEIKGQYTDGGGGALTYPTNTAMETARAALKALDTSKAVVPFVEANLASRNVIVSKYSDNLMSVGPDGTPESYIVSLTLQDAALSAVQI